MRRLLISVLTVGLAALLVWRIALALVPADTRIRWRLEGMAEAFDATRLSPVAAGLAPDFRDQTSGYERALVLDLLRAFYLEHARGVFPYDVDLPEDLIAIDLGEDGATAHATFVADFSALTGDTWKPAWSVQIEAELLSTDDGWRIVRSTHETLTGDVRRLH
jgi:hypothetical protein